SVHQLGRIVHDTRPIVPFVTEAPIHRQVGRVAGDLRVHQASGQQAEADDDRDALPTPAFLREHWTYLHELTQTGGKSTGVRVPFTTSARKFQPPPCPLLRTSSPTRIAHFSVSFRTEESSSAWRPCTRGDGRAQWLPR